MNPFTRIIKAFGYSFSGLWYAIRNETGFLQEIILSLVLIPVALFLDVSITAKILMISSVVFILIMELINSAIEAVVDRISLEKHPLSKHAKDMGSAIVLLAFVQATIIWVGFLVYK
jgi:diacylglycerol kinase (ATP)